MSAIRLFIPDAQLRELRDLAAGEEVVIRLPVEWQGPLQPECWRNCVVRWSDEGHAGAGWYAWDEGYEDEGSFRLDCPLRPGKVWVPLPSKNHHRIREWDGRSVEERPWNGQWVLEDFVDDLHEPRLWLEVLEDGRPGRWCPECDGDGETMEGHSFYSASGKLLHSEDALIACDECDGSPPWWWVARALVAG